MAENLSARAFGTFTKVGMVRFLNYLSYLHSVMEIIAQSLLLHTSHSKNNFFQFDEGGHPTQSGLSTKISTISKAAIRFCIFLNIKYRNI
jgi:hypothetical protein